MKSKFLVNLDNDLEDKWIAKCESANTKVVSFSKEDALAKIKQKFELFLVFEANRYLSGWKRDSHDTVNCPEGKLLLPIDIWKCKLNKEICPTQARVFLNRENEFKSQCTADEKRKEQILDLFGEKMYDGFHHAPGRLKCVLCRGKFKNHYPWEINFLYQYADIFDENLRVEYLKTGMNLSAYSHGLCPECFIGMISNLSYNIPGTFERMDLPFLGRQASKEPAMPSIGILFDIDDLGGVTYDYEAYKIFFSLIDPRAIPGCTITDGDTEETLQGLVRHFCIAVESTDQSKIDIVKTAMNNSTAKGLLSLASRFLDGSRLVREPLVTSFLIDDTGDLVDVGSLRAGEILKEYRNK